MSKKTGEEKNFVLDSELMDSLNDDYDLNPSFNACLNAHGMYETTRFVLRLSPKNHELMQVIEQASFEEKELTSDVIQAYSTYIHETIHWWQHVGSTSGLLFSLSYLAQCHSNIEDLRKVLESIGAKKSLKKYTDQTLLKEGKKAQSKLEAANVAVNNAIDIEFYKAYAYSPRENIHKMTSQPHFESIGHGYYITYGQVVAMISDIIDPSVKSLPKVEEWVSHVQRLNREKTVGYYHGSPIHLPAVGMRAIYETQARFIQLQFLDTMLDSPLSCDRWKAEGYLSGIYIEAFEAFLEISELEWPENLAEPMVALFLLVCDLAINPTRGFPLEIDNFERFIDDVDVGARFTKLCLVVQGNKDLKDEIKNFSKEDYISVSEKLAKLAGFDSPVASIQSVIDWINKLPELKALMDEQETFEFTMKNLPIRVFFSHYISFSMDKLEHPHFFCWPGIYLGKQRSTQQLKNIWLRHLSLFSDRGDKDGVYPRNWPNRSDVAIKKMFQNFYGAMSLYDHTRQWILKDGPFVNDFSWLFENVNQEQVDRWANDSFKQVFGVSLKDFEII